MPKSTGRPSFHALEPAACREILERNHVGRVAFSFRDRVDIDPIHYVFAEGWIYGRSAPGAKLTTLQHNRWVAFEVDEVEGLFEWRSVVVHGAVYFLEPPTRPARERKPDDDAGAVYDTAVALLRELIPAALRHDDPTPARSVIFRIHADAMNGREAVPHGKPDAAL
jgi:nitroimidazol reductase NimA-like FMN-containing flavoprotein (pyridoxamine 5'-phosphate oxidase superfamily)